MRGLHAVRFMVGWLRRLEKGAVLPVPGTRCKTSPAMHLLQSGVDVSVIAFCLGHESPTTTHQYIEADLAMKEKAMAWLQDLNIAPDRCRAGLNCS